MRPAFKVLGAIVLALAAFAVIASILMPRPAIDTPPAILERKELQLQGGRGLVLSVREPVSQAAVDALIRAERSGHALVRVFTYREGTQVGKDQAAGLYEWTVADGLKKRY